ncbi:energy-coupling factor transporter ATPase [Selenomonas sp. F0473]|uniref:energy-coupling factor transporter ATPase n=1 Tax=Selenomonas sp. F0473 TaxID=999423 RepID=UPI00029EA102|nr:energy-coupling factor transporter ATPase [Selenomonas sp. F0473]EKU71598.1 hypothetical protein HMPREF9161_00283 [Selenomonas sp. F0473]
MPIRVESVSYTYMEDTPLSHTALHDLSLTIQDGSFTAIAGETGAGKSTLIQMIGGLIAPTKGDIFIDDVPLFGKTAKERKAASIVRLRVGMVFQYPEHQLFEETVYEDIAFGPRNQGLSEQETDVRVRDAMDLVQLNDAYRDRSPFALSGGEQRRVAIAGVLALCPSYLVLDEPAAGLDPCGRESLMSLLSMLHKERNMTVILVSHSMEDILRAANHLVLIAAGRVVGEGAPNVLFRNSSLLERASLRAPHILTLGQKITDAGYDVIGCTSTEEMARRIIDLQNR